MFRRLSRSSVESPGEVVQVGETHLLRVVSIDPRRQRIGLSLKAVTATEQIEWMAHRDLSDGAGAEDDDWAADDEVDTADFDSDDFEDEETEDAADE